MNYVTIQNGYKLKEKTGFCLLHSNDISSEKVMRNTQHPQREGGLRKRERESNLAEIWEHSTV